MSTMAYLREEIERLNLEVSTFLTAVSQAQLAGDRESLDRASVRLSLATHTRAHAHRVLDSLEAIEGKPPRSP